MGSAPSRWEDQITIHEPEKTFTNLSDVSAYRNDATFIAPDSLRLEKEIDEYITRDTYPLPIHEDREGYGADRHYEYWLSGLSDYLNIKYALKMLGAGLEPGYSVFDFGCASGRVIRHFSCQEDGLDLWCSDINSNHISWIMQFLKDDIRAFQNHALPHLPLEDNKFDLVFTFSVFSHIDVFDLAWLLELNRIMKPGGIACITIHSEHTWSIMREEFPVYGVLKTHPDFSPDLLKKPLPKDKTVFQWRTDNSYRANVFYTTDYIRKTWGKFFQVLEIVPEGHTYQDVVILRKTS